jgi:hypothetical protein
LAPGESALMTLKRGQHRVRLVPECVVTTGTLAALVTVVAAAESGRAEASAASPTGAESTDGASTEIVAAPGESTETVAIPSGSTVAMAATWNADPDADEDGSRESSVIGVRSITPGDSTDPRVSRLLAVIATICVFGVTAAIIRAIVSQRTRSAVPL